MPAQRLASITPFHAMALLARARELEAQGRSVVHMEIGEPDFITPQPVTDAGIRALQAGKTHYTPAAGLPPLRAAIAQHYQDQFGVTLDPRRVLVTPGASGALQLILAALVDPGSQVLMADPGYPCNSNFVLLFEGEPVRVPVEPQGAFYLYADCSRFTEDSFDFATRLLEEAGVAYPRYRFRAPCCPAARTLRLHHGAGRAARGCRTYSGFHHLNAENEP